MVNELFLLLTAFLYIMLVPVHCNTWYPHDLRIILVHS
jgi:hypothetical protein